MKPVTQNQPQQGVLFSTPYCCGYASPTPILLPILEDGRAAVVEQIRCPGCHKDHTADVLVEVGRFNKEWTEAGAPAARLKRIRARMNDVKLGLEMDPYRCVYELRLRLDERLLADLREAYEDKAGLIRFAEDIGRKICETIAPTGRPFKL
jgi:hypothetical protein